MVHRKVNPDIGKALQEYRLKSGLSQTQLCTEYQRLSGETLTKQVLSAYELGKRQPTAMIIDYLLEAYGYKNEPQRRKILVKLLLGI